MFKNCFKKMWKFLNAVRTLEISYTVDEDEPIIQNIEIPTKEMAQNVKMQIDLNKAIWKYRDLNKQKSIEQLKGYLKSKMEKDGLLPTTKDLLDIEREAIVRWEIYKDTNLVDDMYNFKPGVEEVLLEK